jgi:hypothetical protein
MTKPITGMELQNLLEKAEGVFKANFDKAGKLSQVDKGVAKRQAKAGLKDGGSKEDDVLELKKVTVPASSLKPSQRTMVLGKALGMAIAVIRGKMDVKELDAIISKDNHIMDGHHRWAAAIIAGGKAAKVSGWKADENAEDLVRVLNIVSKGKLGVNTGKKGKGKLSEFTPAKAKKMLEDFVKNGIPGEFPVDGKVVAKALDDEFGSVFDGIKTMSSNIRLISKDVPSWAPNRIDMPVVDKKDINTVKAMLKKGTVDWEEPYAESMSDLIGRALQEEYITESRMTVVQNLKGFMPRNRGDVEDMMRRIVLDLEHVKGVPTALKERPGPAIQKMTMDFMGGNAMEDAMLDYSEIEVDSITSTVERDADIGEVDLSTSSDPQEYNPVEVRADLTLPSRLVYTNKVEMSLVDLLTSVSPVRQMRRDVMNRTREGGDLQYESAKLLLALLVNSEIGAKAMRDFRDDPLGRDEVLDALQSEPGLFTATIGNMGSGVDGEPFNVNMMSPPRADKKVVRARYGMKGKSVVMAEVVVQMDLDYSNVEMEPDFDMSNVPFDLP